MEYILNFVIRNVEKNEYKLLESFLYEAIFVPDGVEPPPYEIVFQPELQVYVENFGSRKGDIALCAEADGKIVGAVWEVDMPVF